MREFYKHLKAARQRCNDKNASNYKWYGAKGIKCELTINDVEKLWELSEAKWMFEPQLSRKNHNKNYTFENCEFLDKSINVGESNKRNKSKPILQLDLEGNFIKEWKGQSEAARELNIAQGNIGYCVRGRYKTAYGYIWRNK